MKGARVVEYVPVPTKAVRGKIHKGKVVLDSNRFVKGARIVEYGPVRANAVRANAVRGKSHKGKVLDFQ